MVAAGCRLGAIFGIILGSTVVGSLLIGWLLGSEPQRAVSLGLDVVGAFFLVIGFFIGVRGPFRLGGSPDQGSAHRFVRVAEPDERVETINLSALFVTMGFALVLAGFALDPRYNLV